MICIRSRKAPDKEWEQHCPPPDHHLVSKDIRDQAILFDKMWFWFHGKRAEVDQRRDVLAAAKTHKGFLRMKAPVLWLGWQSWDGRQGQTRNQEHWDNIWQSFVKGPSTSANDQTVAHLTICDHSNVESPVSSSTSTPVSTPPSSPFQTYRSFDVAPGSGRRCDSSKQSVHDEYGAHLKVRDDIRIGNSEQVPVQSPMSGLAWSHTSTAAWSDTYEAPPSPSSSHVSTAPSSPPSSYISTVPTSPELAPSRCRNAPEAGSTWIGEKQTDKSQSRLMSFSSPSLSYAEYLKHARMIIPIA